MILYRLHCSDNDEVTHLIKKQSKQHINFYLNESQSMLAEAVIVAKKPGRLSD